MLPGETGRRDFAALLVLSKFRRFSVSGALPFPCSLPCRVADGDGRHDLDVEHGTKSKRFIAIGSYESSSPAVEDLAPSYVAVCRCE